MDYITLVKGDDTNFVDDQYIVITFNSELDFTGFSAKFTLGGVTLDYNDISSKKINIVLPKEFTSNLKEGKQFGDLKIIDDEGRIRTVTSVIPFLVISAVKTSPTYVNNDLIVQTELNNTNIDITIETAGISMIEANTLRTEINTMKLEAQSSANSAANAANQAQLAIDTTVAAKNEAVAAAQTATTIEERLDGAVDIVETVGAKVDTFAESIGDIDILLEPIHTINLVGAANMLEFLKEDKANKNVANGYAGLNEYGKIPQSRLENGYLRCTINDGPVKENQSDLLYIPDNEVGSVIEVPGSSGAITFAEPKVLKSISAGFSGYSQPFVANLITNGYCECKAWVTYEDGTTAYYINYANSGGGNFSGTGNINLDTTKKVKSINYYTRADASLNVPLGAYTNYSSAYIGTSSYVEIVDTTHNEPKEIYFNCSNEKPLIYTNGLGETFTKVGLQKIDISEINLADGLYRLELPTEGDIAQVVSFPVIYRQKGEPNSPEEGALWIKIGSNVQALIYTDGEWVTYDKVLGGAFWVTDGYITKYVQPAYHIDYIRNNIIDIYINESTNSGYYVYANGLGEQFGITPQITGGGYSTITYLKKYNNDNVTPFTQPLGNYTASAEANDTVSSRSATGFTLYSGHIASQYFAWSVTGFLAEGEF